MTQKVLSQCSLVGNKGQELLVMCTHIWRVFPEQHILGYVHKNVSKFQRRTVKMGFAHKQ